MGVAQLALHVHLLLEACQLGVAGVPCDKGEGSPSATCKVMGPRKRGVT